MVVKLERRPWTPTEMKLAMAHESEFGLNVAGRWVVWVERTLLQRRNGWADRATDRKSEQRSTPARCDGRLDAGTNDVTL